MELLEYFKSIDLEEIKRFVEDGHEERLHLEFKQAAHPSKEPKAIEADKKNISKCISGFANSDGGIVIWGISTSSGKKDEPDTAKALKPISELKKFINLLNRLEGQAVTPTPKGVRHEAIESKKDEGFVKTFVPSSDNAPHMAMFANKHYHKRSGDSFYQAEHYDIRDMFNRRNSAELKVELMDTPYMHRVELRKPNTVVYRWEKIVCISNHGKHFAKAPLLKLKVREPYHFWEFGIDGNRNVGLFGKSSPGGTKYAKTYNGGQDIVVHPHLTYEIDKIVVLASETDIASLPELEVEFTIVAENMPISKGVIKSKFETS